MSTDPAEVPEPTDLPGLHELPEEVRARVVALVAEVLPRVSPLPPAIRRVADFAPARRARLGGAQLAATLSDDADFRARAGTQAALALPDLASVLIDADARRPSSDEQVDAAALAWLMRRDGSPRVLEEAVHELEERQRQRDLERSGAESERLRTALADAEASARELRERLRAQLEAVKGENATLRRKLADARGGQRDAVHAAEGARDEAAAAVASALATSSAQEAEIRRLRARDAALESTANAARRDARSERDDAALRARVLLDVLLDSAQGLRRELALPAVEGAPGERVEAALAAERDEGGSSGAGTLDRTSPALLDSYLAVPRARLIVDGYNVSKAGWPESSLETQRARLLAGIAPLVARSGTEATIVFDAAASSRRPPVTPPRGVKVIFSPYGVIADDVIRDLVAAEPRGRMVVVVTNDQEVVDDVRRAGARAAGSEALLAVLAR